MNRKSLKAALKERFEHHRLSDEQHKRLEALVASARPARRRARPFRPVFGGLAMAAALVLAVALTVFIAHDGAPESPIPERLAQEVFTNHTGIKQLDVESGSFEEIRARFDRLDFVPLNSRLLADQPVRLRGGRYCTLQGKLATQLVYATETGETLTHYQTAYHPEVFGPLPHLEAGDPPLTLHERGLEVRIWVEDGVLMATGQPRG